MAPTSLPISSSHQPRRYRLVDQHGHPHLELDEHFESIGEASALVCQQATAALRRRSMSLLQIS